MANARDIGVQSLRNRWSGSMPKIGLRPIVDSRGGGVRSSQEASVMSLAHNVSDLLSSNLRHVNGLPVDCVVPNHCIGTLAEAANVADLFAREGAEISVTVTDTWAYPTETMDMDRLSPKAVFGFNGVGRPGAIYMASVLAAHDQKGIPAFPIFAPDVRSPDDVTIPDEARNALLKFARASLAATVMRGKSYLSIGGMSMGISGSAIDHAFFERYLGMKVVTVDMSELVRRMANQVYDESELALALRWVKEHCTQGEDPNSSSGQRTQSQRDKDWRDAVAMSLIVRDLMVGNPHLANLGYDEESLGHNAIAAGFQGQRAWTDQFPNGDFLETILNSSFDWNGVREPFIVSTEGDALNAVSMLFGHLVSGGAQFCADVRAYWSPEAARRVSGLDLPEAAAGGLIQLFNSGSSALDAAGGQRVGSDAGMKTFWNITPEEVDACLSAVTWHPVISSYFPGGGYSVSFAVPDMPITYIRLNLVQGLGPVLLVLEGHSVALPPEQHSALDENPTWPTLWFAPRLADSGVLRDVYSMYRNLNVNHGAVSYGHVGVELIALASMLRIPVYMHNVPEDRLLRPTAWTSFGAMDRQGADYRACSSLGPLYG